MAGFMTRLMAPVAMLGLGACSPTVSTERMDNAHAERKMKLVAEDCISSENRRQITCGDKKNGIFTSNSSYTTRTPFNPSQLSNAGWQYYSYLCLGGDVPSTELYIFGTTPGPL